MVKINLVKVKNTNSTVRSSSSSSSSSVSVSSFPAKVSNASGPPSSSSSSSSQHPSISEYMRVLKQKKIVEQRRKRHLKRRREEDGPNNPPPKKQETEDPWRTTIQRPSKICSGTNVRIQKVMGKQSNNGTKRAASSTKRSMVGILNWREPTVDRFILWVFHFPCMYKNQSRNDPSSWRE